VGDSSRRTPSVRWLRVAWTAGNRKRGKPSVRWRRLCGIFSFATLTRIGPAQPPPANLALSVHQILQRHRTAPQKATHLPSRLRCSSLRSCAPHPSRSSVASARPRWTSGRDSARHCGLFSPSRLQSIRAPPARGSSRRVSEANEPRLFTHVLVRGVLRRRASRAEETPRTKRWLVKSFLPPPAKDPV